MVPRKIASKMSSTMQNLKRGQCRSSRTYSHLGSGSTGRSSSSRTRSTAFSFQHLNSILKRRRSFSKFTFKPHIGNPWDSTQQKKPRLDDHPRVQNPLSDEDSDSVTPRNTKLEVPTTSTSSCRDKKNRFMNISRRRGISIRRNRKLSKLVSVPRTNLPNVFASDAPSSSTQPHQDASSSLPSETNSPHMSRAGDHHLQSSLGHINRNRSSLWKLSLLRRVIQYIAHLKQLVMSDTEQGDDAAGVAFIQREMCALAVDA